MTDQEFVRRAKELIKLSTKPKRVVAAGPLKKAMVNNPPSWWIDQVRPQLIKEMSRRDRKKLMDAIGLLDPGLTG